MMFDQKAGIRPAPRGVGLARAGVGVRVGADVDVGADAGDPSRRLRLCGWPHGYVEAMAVWPHPEDNTGMRVDGESGFIARLTPFSFVQHVAP